MAVKKYTLRKCGRVICIDGKPGFYLDIAHNGYNTLLNYNAIEDYTKLVVGLLNAHEAKEEAKRNCVYCKGNENHLYCSPRRAEVMPGDW